MCRGTEATTFYGVAVCQPCHDWLVELAESLVRFEDENPDLAAKGRAVDEAAKVWMESL